MSSIFIFILNYSDVLSTKNIKSFQYSHFFFKSRHKNFTLFHDHLAKLEKSVLDFNKPRLFQEPHVKRRQSVREILPLKLFIVAALLARHKYTGNDPRQNDGFEPKVRRLTYSDHIYSFHSCWNIWRFMFYKSCIYTPLYLSFS